MTKNKERDNAAIVLSHVGRAARLLDKMATEGDDVSRALFNRRSADLSNIYLTIKAAFPGLEEAKKLKEG